MSTTLENKIDLLLSLHQDHNARLKRLETKIDPHSQSKEKRWISCSEMGKRVGLQGRTIQKYINSIILKIQNQYNTLIEKKLFL